MGHDHKDPYTIPDYKIYKVEDVPLLLNVQRALASQGLKDPWLRNEVWRYNEKTFGSMKSRVSNTFFRGFRLGVGMVVVTLLATAAYDKVYPEEHHSHGHDSH